MHQHGGRPGSSGRGPSGGGARDVGSRNWEIAHGIDVGTKGSGFAPGSANYTGGGGEDESVSCCIDTVAEADVEEQTKRKSVAKKFSDIWKLSVNESEWDLSDVISIDRPCRNYYYWTLTHENGKKTRISGNVILEEI